MLHGRIPLTILATALLSALMALPAQAAPVYPDLQTFEPRELMFQERDTLAETEPCPPATPACRPPGPRHNLLRFTNTVFNGGEGRLEVFGTVTNPGQPGSEGRAIQRIFDENGSAVHRPRTSAASTGTPPTRTTTSTTGAATSSGPRPTTTPGVAHDPTHPGHEDEAMRRGVKTTSCVMDEEFIGGPATHAVPRPLPVRRLQPDRRRPDEAGPVARLGRHLRLLPRRAVDRPRAGRHARQRAGGEHQVRPALGHRPQERDLRERHQGPEQSAGDDLQRRQRSRHARQRGDLRAPGRYHRQRPRRLLGYRRSDGPDRHRRASTTSTSPPRHGRST